MKFKTEELETQFASHALQDRLRRLLVELDGFMSEQLMPEMVVTSLIRPQDLKSDHRDGHAADIRAHDLKTPDLAGILNWVHEHYWRETKSVHGWPARAAYAHGEGENFHIHLTVDRLV